MADRPSRPRQPEGKRSGFYQFGLEVRAVLVFGQPGDGFETGEKGVNANPKRSYDNFETTQVGWFAEKMVSARGIGERHPVAINNASEDDDADLRAAR